MDDQRYYYHGGTNRLRRVSDTVTATTYAVDIDDQSGVPPATYVNYTYDAIGNLTGDVAEGIADIDWSPYGKVLRVKKTVPPATTPTTVLSFVYDAQGNRVLKKALDPVTGETRTTYYVYEAGGKVVAIYTTICPPLPPAPPPMASGGDKSGGGLMSDGDLMTGGSLMAMMVKDSDRDGMPDSLDNCPCRWSDGPIVDSDGDGMGDLCDPEPGVPATPGTVPDSDGDGDDDFHDNCLCEPNPDQEDDDQDGVGDACDGTSPAPCDLKLSEWIIYGNSAQGRFATVRPVNIGRGGGVGAPLPNPEEKFTRILAEKVYELNDHLGNVRVVVTDVKQPETQSGQHPYVATLEAVNNYYPYGMLQPQRSWQTTRHRYGYNGKEMDNEWNNGNGTSVGTGASYDYGSRIYDARLSRFMSVDPLGAELPDRSTYEGIGSNPVLFIDPDGRKIEVYTDPSDPNTTIIKITGSVINLSSERDLNIEALRDEIAEQAADLNGQFQDRTGATRNLRVEVDLQIAERTSDIGEIDNVIAFADFRPRAEQSAWLEKNGWPPGGWAPGVTAYSGMLAFVDVNHERTNLFFPYYQPRGRVSVHELLHQVFMGIGPTPKEEFVDMHAVGLPENTVFQRAAYWEITDEGRANLVEAATETARLQSFRKLTGTHPSLERIAVGGSTVVVPRMGPFDLFPNIVDRNRVVENATAPDEPDDN